MLDSPEKQDDEQFEEVETNAIEFIGKFGSYLNLFEALNAASEKFSVKIIQKLLELANHDPIHVDYMKLFARTGNFVPYEPRVLSCLLAILSSSTKEVKEVKSRIDMISMAVAAYPDLKPWQLRSTKVGIRTRCWESLSPVHLKNAEKDNIIFYYDYLSQLMESSQMARSDVTLVNEWCFLSTTKDLKWAASKRRQNFLDVASGSGSEKKLEFVRDALQLIEFSSEVKDHKLTLKLANEVVSKPSPACDNDALMKMMKIIHNVTKHCLSTTNLTENNHFDVDLMTEVLNLLKAIGTSTSVVIKESLDAAVELGIILDQCPEQEQDSILKEEALISLIAATMPSSLALRTLSNRSIEHIPKGTIISALRKSLEKRAEERPTNEISNALIHLRRIRPQRQSSKDSCQAPGLWKKMLLGTAVINNK